MFRKDSPTCPKESLHMTLTIIASHGWMINCLDIQSAFLQDSGISREIFLKPPVEASTKNLRKLRKCVYGLSAASRSWYLRVAEESCA